MVALGVCTSSDPHHGGLGYMAGMFHLFTHAMFKALLFLGAGSIIHAVHTNEMSAMGGLRKYMPITHITFLIACLAIAGIPPFSGFFSKDEILAACFQYQPDDGLGDDRHRSYDRLLYVPSLLRHLLGWHSTGTKVDKRWYKPRTYSPRISPDHDCSVNLPGRRHLRGRFHSFRTFHQLQR